jgi:hypothetical protein
MNKKSIVKRTVLGALCTGACTYVVAFGVMVGFGEAKAVSVHASSECHAAADDVGTVLQNSGVLTYTGFGYPVTVPQTNPTIKIYCPAGPGIFGGASVTVYGSEGTDGSTSRNCDCALGTISCNCANPTGWVNSSSSVVATNLDTFGLPREQTFGYVLHMMTHNSTLAGMLLP